MKSQKRHRRLATLWVLVWLVSVGLPACQSSQAGQGLADAPASRDSLVNFFRKTRAMWVVYGTQTPLAAAYRAQLDSLKQHSWIDLHPVADTAIEEDELKQQAHALLGTPQTNRWMAQWQAQLPVSFEEDGFHFAGHEFSSPGQVLQMSWVPSPANSRVPMGLLTATRDSALLAWLSQADNPFFSRWSYQVFGAAQRLMLGMFDAEGRPGGQPHYDFTRQVAPDHETAHLRLYQQQSRRSLAELRALADRVERRIRNLQQWLGDTSLSLAPVNYHLYPDAERMGLMCDAQQQVYLQPDQHAVHRIVNDHYLRLGLQPHEDLLPFIRQALPAPSTEVLAEGVAVYLTPQWQREGAAYWVARLHASSCTLSLEALTGHAPDPAQSPLIRAALASALVDFLVQTWGRERFLAQYARWRPDTAELAQLRPRWRHYLDKLVAAHPAESWPHVPLPYYRGMTLAHEGYSIYDGYGSDSAQAAVAKLASLHVNSIALVPYTGSRALHEPTPFRVWQRAGSENDAAVVGSFRHARQWGLQTLMKPQIWFRGGWPGEVEMGSIADWQQFFGYYRAWIAHYALLAAMHEMDAFCVGVEFAQATLQYPEGWRRLIRDLRQIYPGPITYAANWGEEAANLDFAAELDFIGIDCYYPLSQATKANKAALTWGFAHIKQKLARIAANHQRPIVLTEVGFRCVSHPWVNPHADPEGRPYNPEAQRLAYEVVLAGLADAGWCRGMFWWKWPSYMSYAARHKRSFTPCHRPAMQVLAKEYARLAARP